MQTATNPQTGEKLVLQNGQWVPVGGAQPKGPVYGAPPLPKQPDIPSGYAPADGGLAPIPGGPAEFQRSQQAQQQGNQRFDNISNLRKEYNALPSVKDYGETLKALGGAWKAPDNAQGDLAVIYAFAKVMDPGSVVREGEMDMANSTSSVIQDIYRKYGRIAEGNRLPPEVRKQLIQSAMGRGAALNQAYKQERARYRQIAEQNGVPADQILGPHAGDAYAEIGQEFDRHNAPRLTDEELDAQFKEKIRNRESPAAIIAWLQANGQPITDENIAQITANIGNANPRVERESPNAEAFKAGIGDLAEGTGDLLGLIGNPLNAGINAVAGTNLSTDLGQTFRDATGMPQGNPVASAINQGGVAALSGAGLAGGLARAAPSLARYAAPLAAEPLRQTVAGAGAGAGSELARQNNLGPVGQMAGGIAGGMGAYGGANALLKVAGGSRPSELSQIAQRQGVEMMPADVGGPVSRRITGAATQSPFSAGPVIDRASKTQAQIGNAAGRIARREGDVLPEDEAGEALVGPLKGYSQKQASRIGRVYERAESRARGVKIKPQQAVAFLDEQIARFKGAPMGESIASELQAVRDKIAKGVSVAGMRDARTILSQSVYDGKLRSGQQKGIYKQFLGLLSKDIEGGLSAAGRRDALNLFKVADKAWSERISYVDDVLEPVIGKAKSGEQILATIEGMARGKGGGVRRLSELLRELPPEQAGNIRATIIDRLGKATPGQQDATGEQFSAASFLTRWSQMSPKGKAALFGSGELRTSLDEIAKLSAATKATGKYASHSNTPGGILSNVGLIAAGGYFPKTALTALVVQHATGRLMASPRFASWLARVPNNPALLEKHTGQLAQIAAREPIIANDIASIQQYLSSATQRAAAGSENQAE